MATLDFLMACLTLHGNAAHALDGLAIDYNPPDSSDRLASKEGQ
jgi:hypothetical protein